MIWTFVVLAAIGNPVATGGVDTESLGDFRIVYDLVWLTSIPIFTLLADAAYGAERPWLRAMRAVLIVAATIGAVLIPVVTFALLLR